MKWLLFALLTLILLISCAPATQEVVTKPVTNNKIEAPKTEPVLEPEVKAPQEVAPVPTPVPAPKIEAKPALSPEEECKQDCEENCAATSQNSCTQSGRVGCKEICNDNPVIDSSACTQACTYLNQPNVCKQQMGQFCSAQCVNYCH